MQIRDIIRASVSAIIILFFLLHLGDWQRWSFIDRIDNILYDSRLNMAASGHVDPRIMIVDIDEKSLAAEGRWPWNRDRVALLIDNLFGYYQIDLLGIDVVFADTTEGSGMKVIEQLEASRMANNVELQNILKSIKPKLEYDRILANALSQRAVVMGFTQSDQTGVAGALSPPLEIDEEIDVASLDLYEPYGFSGNLKILMDNAIGAGFFSNPAANDESDGIYRRAAMLLKYEDQLYPSLSLSMLNVYLENPGIGVEVYPEAPYLVAGITVGNRVIPTGQQGTILVPYQGGKGTFRYVSATDIIERSLDPNELKNAIIFLGTSAPGLQDLRSTPVGATYPGVEIHANLLAGMLNHYINSEPNFTGVINVIIMLLFGITLSVVFIRYGPSWGALVFVVGILMIIGISHMLWQKHYVLPLAGVLMGSMVLFVFHAIYGFFSETLGKHHLAGLFGQYVPEELVDEMAKDPQKFSLAGQQKQMTVLFSDVRGFTTISTNMDPTELSDLMNEFLTPLTHVIHKYKGTIDKYMGDAIMAFWNAPVDDPEHAKNALLAGMAMIEEMNKMAPDFKSRGLPELKIGVGVNTGEMNVGNMGSKFRMAYTVLGDAVNLGSRLEGVTKEYGVDMIVGEETKAAVPEMVFRELDRVQVKGRPIPVAIYEPVGLQSQVDETTWDALRLFSDVLAFYRKRQWHAAEKGLLNLKNNYPPHKVYDVYLERVQFFQKDYEFARKGDPEIPDEDWDGVFKLKTK